VPRMRDPLAAPNQRHVAKRETRRPLQPTERNVLDQRENVASKSGEVDELAMPLVPLRATRWSAP
jgi:hypothetical protein